MNNNRLGARRPSSPSPPSPSPPSPSPPSSLHWCYTLQVLSSLLYALGAVCTKVLSYDVDIWTIIVFRGLLGLCFCTAWNVSSQYLIPPKAAISLPYSPRARRRADSQQSQDAEGDGDGDGGDGSTWYYYTGVRRSRALFNLIRLTLGALGVLLYVLSISMVNVSEAFLVISTNPLLTAIIAPLFLDESSWRMYDTVVCLVCLLGITLICEPTSEWDDGEVQQMEGLLAAFGCALCMAGNCIAIRYYSNEPANNYIVWGMLGTLLIGLPYFLYEQGTSSFDDLASALDSADKCLLLLAMSASTWSASMTKTLSLQRSSGIFILVLNYTGAVFTVLLDVLVLGTTYDAVSWAGMTIVLLACIASVVNRAPRGGASLDDYLDKAESVPLLMTQESSSGSSSTTTTTTTTGDGGDGVVDKRRLRWDAKVRAGGGCGGGGNSDDGDGDGDGAVTPASAWGGGVAEL